MHRTLSPDVYTIELEPDSDDNVKVSLMGIHLLWSYAALDYVNEKRFGILEFAEHYGYPEHEHEPHDRNWNQWN